MTTSVTPVVAASVSTDATRRPGALPGFGSLLRKELTEWRRGRKAWVVLGVTTLVMILTVVNSWLISTFAGDIAEEPINLDALTNLGIGVSSHMYVVAAIFAVMSVLVAERESGTLAWTASKPVSRTAIWLAKWVAATAVIFVLAALIPFAVTVVEAIVLYGSLEPGPVAVMVLGMALAVAFYTTVVLATSTYVNSQAGVASIAVAVAFLPTAITGILPIGEFLPTSIVGWAMGLASGQAVGFITPISLVLTTVALGLLAVRRMERLEL
jgi:ABC-type transport system involved in multi-copper enzyme maturation permease subunit